jgi:small GTP-binding protein
MSDERSSSSKKEKKSKKEKSPTLSDAAKEMAIDVKGALFSHRGAGSSRKGSFSSSSAPPTPKSSLVPPAPPSLAHEDEDSAPAAPAGTPGVRSKRFTMRVTGVSPPLQEHADYVIKVTLFGASAVGKTSLIHRMLGRAFRDKVPSTIGVESYGYFYQTAQDQKQMKVGIWDTAGQERFNALMPNYYRGTHAFMAVFDVCDSESWHALFKPEGFVGTAQSIMNDALVMVVGNKIDRKSKRQVSEAMATEYCAAHNFLYMETSAKQNMHVEQALQELLEAIYVIRIARPEPVAAATPSAPPSASAPLSSSRRLTVSLRTAGAALPPPLAVAPPMRPYGTGPGEPHPSSLTVDAEASGRRCMC